MFRVNFMKSLYVSKLKNIPIIKKKFRRKFRRRYSSFLNRKDAPWFNMAAVEFLDTLDLSKYRVLEFGSGSSTLYFAQKCKSVKSFEMNSLYFEYTDLQLKSRKIKNVSLNLYENNDIYPVGKYYNSSYSLVVLDDTNRGKALLAILKAPTLPKIIIFDNSDWMPNHLSLIFKKYFIINFIDFPRTGNSRNNFKLNHFVTQTSICFKKTENFPPQILSEITNSQIAGSKLQSKKSKLLDTL